MAPRGFLAAAAGLLARSVSVLSHTGTAARCTGALSVYGAPLRSWTSQTNGPPKRPLNGYLRYVMQQKPVETRQNPDIKSVEIIRKIAQQWRLMSLEQKQPFQEASLRAREQFRLDLQRYQAQLSPAQIQQQALEKRERLAKRRAIRKKRELTSLGKPKRPRSPFNIFMSEHFEEARGTTTQSKMKSLLEDWRNLFSHQKQVYSQLAEDDKVRYKNEMRSWEDHMLEIGREDLIREQTLSTKKVAKTKAVKKDTKKAKAKPAKKAAAKQKPKATGRVAKASTANKASPAKRVLTSSTKKR